MFATELSIYIYAHMEGVQGAPHGVVRVKSITLHLEVFFWWTRNDVWYYWVVFGAADSGTQVQKNPVVAHCTATTSVCNTPADLCHILSWVVWCLVSRWLWALIIIMSPLPTIETINVIWRASVKTWNENCIWWCGVFDECMVPSTTTPMVFPVPFISRALGMLTS